MVRKCIEKTTRKTFAVKIIDLTHTVSHNDAEAARKAGYNEINLLKTCSEHRYISKLYLNRRLEIPWWQSAWPESEMFCCHGRITLSV